MYPKGFVSTKKNNPKKCADISEPHEHDVLCGRGGGVNNHVGNCTYRRLIFLYKPIYIATKKSEKIKIAKAIVDAIRCQDPPGRFLERNQLNGLYFEIDEKKAIYKTSQALREGQPNILKKMNEIKSQLSSFPSVDNNNLTARQSKSSNSSYSNSITLMNLKQTKNQELPDLSCFPKHEYLITKSVVKNNEKTSYVEETLGNKYSKKEDDFRKLNEEIFNISISDVNSKSPASNLTETTSLITNNSCLTKKRGMEHEIILGKNKKNCTDFEMITTNDTDIENEPETKALTRVGSFNIKDLLGSSSRNSSILTFDVSLELDDSAQSFISNFSSIFGDE